MSAEPEKVVSFEALTGRTEDAAVFNDYGSLKFGDREFKLSKPNIRKTRVFLSKFKDLQSSSMERAKKEGNDELNSLEFLIDNYFPQMAEMVSEYCQSSGLNVEVIETEGTYADLVKAFKQIGEICRLPLAEMQVQPEPKPQ